MKKTGRTVLAFDERQILNINKLKLAFTSEDGKAIDNKDIFLIAMSVGYASKNRLTDFKRSGTGVRIQYFNPEDNVLFAALQVAETNDSKSLLEIDDLYDLAELYAGGGMAILWEHYQKERNFAEWFASLIHTPLKEMKSA